MDVDKPAQGVLPAALSQVAQGEIGEKSERNQADVVHAKSEIQGRFFPRDVGRMCTCGSLPVLSEDCQSMKRPVSADRLAVVVENSIRGSWYHGS